MIQNEAIVMTIIICTVNYLRFYIIIDYICAQSKVLESKAKQVHFQQDLKSSNLNVEAWLLARKSLAGSEY